MDKKKRVFIYITACYIFISLLLSFVFVATYRYYFYEVQKFSILKMGKAREELVLRTIHEQYKHIDKALETKEKIHQDFLKTVAKDKINDIKAALLSHSSKKDLEQIQDDVESRDELDLKGIKNYLRPSKKKEAERTFIRLFDELTSDKKGMIQVRRSGEGVPQLPVPMNYIQLEKDTIELYSGGYTFKWTLKAYGLSRKDKGLKAVSVDDILKSNNLSILGEEELKRLAVYTFGNTKPIYKGESNYIKPAQIDYHVKNALEKGTMFNSEITERVQYQSGEAHEKVNIVSIICDPNLKLSFSMIRVIDEDEWMQFPFFSRAKVPILLYAALAWVVCPLLVFIAYKMALKFRFTLTLDLDGEREGFVLENEEPSGLTIDLDNEVEGEIETVEPASDPQRATPLKENENIPNRGDSPLSVPVHAESAKAGPKPAGNGRSSMVKRAEVMSSNSPFAQINPNELLDIRENNIRKSQGTFNGREDEDEDVDYLEGVQSDVLKSLIKKLRED